MRWLVVALEYADFTRHLYEQHPGLAQEPYEQQLQVRMNTRFGTADAYSHNLQALGHEAVNVFPDNEILQRRWAAEHGVRVGRSCRWRMRLRGRSRPRLIRERKRDWLFDILAAQVEAYRPDILFCMGIETVDSEFLRRVKGCYRMAVAQHAAMLLPGIDPRKYDLVVSSLPNLVDHFRGHGMASELFRLGFDARVLEELDGTGRSLEVVFVGGLSGVQHEPGARLLERVCQRHDVQIWGYGAEGLPADSVVRQHCRGPLWGPDMYRTLGTAKIVLNRHGPVALHYANNIRLYEATGVGTLLLTDRKQNLAELFEPGREVVAYGDAEECIERVGYYLEHDDEREAIARAGQARTLREHTYAHRVQELVDIVRKYL